MTVPWCVRSVAGMKALIVYESMYGNTRQVAEVVAASLHATCDVELVVAEDARVDARDVDLIVVGGPTHVHGLASAMTRRSAAKAGEDHRTELDPGATASR